VRRVELLNLVFLVGPTLWLGFRYYRDFYSFGDTKAKPGTVIPLTALTMYVSFIVSFGVQDALQFFADDGFRRRGLWTFALPGLGFAMAAFPYQAAEYTSLIRHGLSSFPRLLGWLILGVVAVRHWLVL
jgi:hypothetical protein